MNLSKGLLLPAAMLLNGCTPHIAPGVETRAFLASECPVTGETARPEATGLEPILIGIAANLAGQAIGVGIDALSAQLKDDKEVNSESTERTSDLLTVTDGSALWNGQASCVVAVVGVFDKSEYQETWAQDILAQMPLEDDVRETARARLSRMDTGQLATLQRLRKLYAYAEYNVVYSKDVRFLSYDTPYFVIREFAGEGFGVARTRDVRLSAEVRIPGGQVLVGMESTRMSVKKSDLPLVSSTSRGPWQPVDAKVTMPPENSSVPYLPGNLKVQYIETGKPGALSKMVGEALASKREELVKLAQDKTRLSLSSQDAQAAQITDATAAATRLTEYQAALDALNAAAAALPKGGNAAKNDYEIKLKVLKARERLAKAAFREAGLAFEPGDVLQP